jgi:outer membrane protein TolC
MPCGRSYIPMFVLILAAFPLRATTLSLTDAVRYAVRHSPLVNSQDRLKEIEALKLSSLRAKFLPSADISATLGLGNYYPLGDSFSAPVNTGFSSPSNPYLSQANLSITENLYDNGATINRYKAGEITNEVAQLSIEKSKEDLSLAVVAEFHNYSLARQISALKQTQVEVLRKQFQSIEEQYKNGLRVRQDYLRFKTKMQRAEIEQNNSVREGERSALRLKSLLGITDSETPNFTFEILEPAVIELASVSTAPPVENNYEYKMAQKLISVSDLDINLAQRKFWPQFNINGGVNYQNGGFMGDSTSITSTSGFGWNVLLTANFNIWDWGQRRNDIQIEKVNRSVRENDLRKIRLSLDSQVKTLMIDIAEASDNFRLTQELMKLDQESYQVLKDKFEEGKAIYLDLITGLGDVFDSKTRFYSSYFSLATHVAKYKYFNGKLYDSFFDRKN